MSADRLYRVSAVDAADADQTRTSAGQNRPPRDRSAPARIGRYRVLETLGEGGMGTVFAAEDPELHRRVAIKILRSASPGAAERLLREARAMAQLRHPNVVTVYEVGRSGSDVFIAMELVEGTTLRTWLRQEHGLDERLGVMCMAGAGLAAAHEQGLIHRDFKPDNVMVGVDGRPQVVDFGVATLASSPDADGVLEVGDAELSPELVSRSGGLIGTPAYMAPEQFLMEATDQRTDQFSFCSVLFEAVHGVRPFPGSTVTEIGDKVLAGKRAELTPARDVPERVVRAIERGLSTDPDERFPDMQALLAQLRPRPRRRRVLWAAVALAAVLLAGGIGWLAMADDAGSICQRAGDDVASVWSGDSRAALTRAFEGSGLSYADQAAERVSSILDQRAASWAATRRDVCEATWVRGEQSEALLDLRMDCLDRRLSELRFFVELYAGDVDRELGARAAQAALSLEPVEDCAHVSPASAAYPAPRDPERRRRLAALHERVDELEVMFVAGRYRQGVSAGEAVLAEADALGFAPAQAEVLLVLGELLSEAGEHERADETFARGILVAMKVGDFQRAAQTYAKRIALIGVEQDRHAEALVLRTGAESALALAGEKPLLRAELLRALGTVYMGKGDLESARDHLRRSLALYEEHAADDPMATATLNNLGLVYFKKGEYEEAIRHLDRARAQWEISLGPEHPWVATTLNNLASAHWRSNRFDDALRQYQLALELLTRALGPEHPDVAAALTNVGVALDKQGKYEEAGGYYVRALELREKTLGPKHQKVGIALYNLGNFFMRHKGSDEAIPYLRRAVEVFEASVGPKHDYTGMALGTVAHVLQGVGDNVGAIEPFERSLAILLEKKSADVPVAQFGLARALWGAGRQRERARRLAAAAREGFAAADRDQEVRQVERWLASLAGR